MRWIRWFVVLLAVLLSPHAKADVYNVNLNNLQTLPGTGGIVTELNFCFTNLCDTEKASPVYLLGSLNIPAGSTINFGEIDLTGFSACGPGTCGSTAPQFTFGVIFGASGLTLPPINSFGGLTCFEMNFTQCSVPIPTSVVPLVFDIGGATEFQFAYTGNLTAYVPPVPEPSTWAMLLIGFAGIGFAACRRSQQKFAHS